MGVKKHVIIILGLKVQQPFMTRREDFLYAKWGGAIASYVLCYVGHLMSGLRPYFFTLGHISDPIGDIPAVKSSKLPCSMFFIAQTFTISQAETQNGALKLI